MSVNFNDVARMASPDDNVAIATHQLDAGLEILRDDVIITISHTVLTGHRFAVNEIKCHAPLLSWGQTFGIASKPISVGDYVVNADVLEELQRRSLDISLPIEANFTNELERYTFDAISFMPASAMPQYEDERTFMGYLREGRRGVGTRNTIVILGTTAIVGGFVRKLEANLQHYVEQFPNIDSIVAIAHTEGAHGKPNNKEYLLRTLAGFIVHPNVAAALIVDDGNQAITNRLLNDFMQQNNYPLNAVHHQFMTLTTSFEDDLAHGERIVTDWFDLVNEMQRNAQPLSKLKIALQCGGSDAFSGISGNPLAAWVAKEIIRYGGCANLAETDELIGAERYVLDKVRNPETAQRFLKFIEQFKEQLSWHGHTADANPSGGNKFRGLYNIYLKSLGAATKRDPQVRLDYAIDYAEPMRNAGFHFMNSPGNDLESIAGQVAAGCNMIFFVTGNGSITNFPFVPTIKIVTTTERYNLLSNDMDINAGAYLDGIPLADVGAETLDYTVKVASGQLSVGERAGHSQVQIWRDWHFTQRVDASSIRNRSYTGKPIPINTDVDVPDVQIDLLQDNDIITSQQIGLILPTSLCSGQIARLCVEKLNKHPTLTNSVISRFVTLTHTEGCGTTLNPEFSNTLLAYLKHPFVKHALLLEHGCEQTHNDYFRQRVREMTLEPENYGWASIQRDGGIHAVIQKMVNWFVGQIKQESKPSNISGGLETVRLGLVTDARIEDSPVIERLTQMIVKAGGLVVVSENDPILETNYADHIHIDYPTSPTIAYAGDIVQRGFHIMEMPTRNRSEILAGLGTQVDLILSIVDKPLPGHPMIPTLNASYVENSHTDIVIHNTSYFSLLNTIISTLSGRYTPLLSRSGNVNFQITRGLLGIST